MSDGIAALLSFEWIVTLDDDIDLFWKKRKTLATGLFLINRLFPMVYALSAFVIPGSSQVGVAMY